jgi:two-component system cell cycle response regulator CpdR
VRILAADDDRDMLDAVAHALERAGHSVVRASCGAELVQHLAEGGRFDLMITDIRMPWMNGLQAALAARNAGMRMPILVISGLDDARVVEQVRALGPHAELMRKPFGLAELERTVERLLVSAA